MVMLRKEGSRVKRRGMRTIVEFDHGSFYLGVGCLHPPITSQRKLDLVLAILVSG
jgi:hypothetical protein